MRLEGKIARGSFAKCFSWGEEAWATDLHGGGPIWEWAEGRTKIWLNAPAPQGNFFKIFVKFWPHVSP